jgi:Domain of unknown function (DUF2341).
VLVCANGTLGNGNSCQTVAGLNQSGGGAHVQNANGYDITFWSNSNCTGAMNWEVESYTASTGVLYAWVKIPSLLAAGNTIYMCYGDSSISSFQGGSTGSNFDASSKVVYHMADSGSTLTDSTANGNNATKKSSTAPSLTSSGFIHDAQVFAGTANTTSNDYATFPASVPNANTWTIEWWGNQNINPPHTAGLSTVFFQHTSQNIGAGYNWFPTGTLKWRNDFNTGQTPTASGTASPGSWHHIVFVRNGDSMNIYLDGTAGTAQTGFGTSSDSFLGLGFSGSPTTVWDTVNGYLDEIRLSNTVRSTDWITIEYNTTVAPASFETFGSETSLSTAVPALFFGSEM